VKQAFQKLLDFINSISNNDSLTLKDVLSRCDNENWKEVVKLEYKSLMDRKTWKLIQLPEGREALGCKWSLRRN
jgi:hypothetical protein